ncbi:hypothetical protein [Niveibacterium umoris]|uniref:Uncharacterized protein n=1 Tax=Niveibacterium umoris TaxID=1193620 RepID=A0A840BKL5_9RHOO|nr:hypothetical protein [Niveibacterium umoris]MBB4011426.1 hypothetical protein [Niveibacterium umoris]
MAMLLLSIIVHAMALGLFPPLHAGARSLRVRIQQLKPQTGPGADKQSVSASESIPVMAHSAMKVPRAIVPSPATAPQPSSKEENTRQQMRERQPARGESPPARLPDSAPIVPAEAGLDAATMRGVRVALAQGLGGIEVPPGLAGARTEARMVFGGGRLLALTFSGDSLAREFENVLRPSLMRSAAAIRLPADLRDARFEITLALEFDG